ncbi:protein MSF1 [Nadsonia fulvescens var. elongata DSM 6958]|uniref:Protein MSF1 n=1 Tax=Nadsonia fulvescens var. elongata DSM 6958 TaxID=857566 RepID=A0A1E3PT85_9ASCO|nr:protein MSF1 [Nadsonia fulvescens var. elongata DSM 6958]
MKTYQLQHTIDYPWWFVTAAYWHKYPNPFSTHIVSIDVLRQEYDPETKRLRVERLVSMKQSVPIWLTRIVSRNNTAAYVREVTEVDLVAQTFITRSFNMTMNHLARIDETVSYKVYRDNLHQNQTQFQQEAKIKVIGSSYYNPISNKLEQWSAGRFGSNAEKGFKGLLEVLNNLAH